jgi:ABC-2 type transport system permease protein
MSTTTERLIRGASTPRATRRHPSLADTTRWELSKLGAQLRARIALVLCLVAPVVVVIVVNGQGRPPKDTLYGRYVHESGYAVPLLILGFATQWLLPLLTALVAGDIFASEDQHGTWKTVLTRSAGRAQVFWAKTITIVASVVIVGHQDLVGLTGQLIPSGRAAGLVVASWATALAPLVGFTCLAILLSVRTGNPAFGIAAPVVIGMVMTLVGGLGGVEAIRPLLLTTPFESWHGLLAEHQFFSPLIVGLVVSAGWSIACLAAAFVSLRRADITGG